MYILYIYIILYVYIYIIVIIYYYYYYYYYYCYYYIYMLNNPRVSFQLLITQIHKVATQLLRTWSSKDLDDLDLRRKAAAGDGGQIQPFRWKNMEKNMGKPWKNMEKPWKSMRNHEKTWKKTWENHEKSWKNMEKPWEIMKKHGKKPLTH